MSQEVERVLDWEDEIQDSGPDFTLLPAGDYNFTIEKFERARHQGSANLPACPMALLTLKVDGGNQGTTTVIHRLFLHSKTEGFLSAFFESIGQKQEGERVRMNWQAVTRASGRCRLEVNEYKNKDGQDRSNNQVDKFLPYEEYLKHAGQQQQTQQAPPAQQQQQFNQQQAPQTQQNQAPFPTGQPQQGNFTPGAF